MFTIEHEFEATVVTLIDEGGRHLEADLKISAYEECVTLEQVDPHTDCLQRITLSMVQIQELATALDLPEGSYRFNKTP